MGMSRHHINVDRGGIHESKKGLYIGIFWAIFNLGGVVGASVSLGENFHSQVGFIYIICFYIKLIRVDLGGIW